MASLGATAAVQAGGLSFASKTLPVLSGLGGFAIVALAGFLDQKYVYPALLGKKQLGRPRELFDVPTGGTTEGAPRIWALGHRLRVPMHPMFRSAKVRESTAGGAKGGVAGTLRRVFADCAFAINDRLTNRSTQYIANGKLLWWRDRNLLGIRTSGMVVSSASGRLVLTMVDTFEADFADYFAIDDVVTLDGFDANGGPDITGIWKVHDVTRHGGTPSTLTLDIYGGQSIAGLAATAGTVTSPASVFRVDGAFYDHTLEGRIYSSSDLTTQVVNGNRLLIPMTTDQRTRFDRIFSSGDLVKLVGWTETGGGSLSVTDYVVLGYFGPDLMLGGAGITATLAHQPFVSGTSTNAGSIQFQSTQSYVPGVFASDPDLHYHAGSEVASEDSVISRTEPTGTIPAFRGMAYQVFDQFDLSTYFGNQMPILEAIIEPDVLMNWRQAIETICARYGVEASQLDLDGVTARPFEGMYLLGALTGIAALTPLLIAGQILTQDRGPKIAFFELENADVVQIENGAAFSDLGTTSGSGTPTSGDKIAIGQVAIEDLPTRIVVRHQDADNVYAPATQPFGIRSPTAVRHRKEEEIDLSMLAMTRKQAKNLAATLMRRTWVNSDTMMFQLPVAYLEVCENDLLTLTDDDGNDILCRATRVDIGANFVVAVTAVRENLSLATAGSPVQPAGDPPPPIVQAATPVAAVLDVPPLGDDDRFSPMLYLAACAPRGGHWGGAVVYESRDGGASYTSVATITQECGIGVTISTLDAGPAGEDAAGTVTWDTSASLDVQLDSEGLFPPVTSTEASVLGGFNWALVDAGSGDFEILGFRDVTDNGGGSYTLSHMIRGLRGTYPSAAADKTAGARFVLLLGLPAARRPIPTDVPVTLRYKFLAPGQALADVDHIELDAEGWNARPMVVRDFDWVRDAGTENRTLTPRHWSRLNLPVGSTGPFALDETAEGYRVRIYAPDGTTLVRVKHRDARGTGSPTLGDASMVYTAAEQTTDGYTPGPTETYWIELEQLGDFGTNSASGAAERRGGRTYRQEV